MTVKELQTIITILDSGYLKNNVMSMNPSDREVELDVVDGMTDVDVKLSNDYRSRIYQFVMKNASYTIEELTAMGNEELWTLGESLGRKES